MNTIYRIYFALPNFAVIGILGKAINRVLELFLVYLFHNTMPYYLRKTASKQGMGINTTEHREQKFIVSLTSFPARIDKIWITIECLLRQTFKPDRILLWLAYEQFPNQEEDLPNRLLNLKERGLEIKFCEDLKSHKKYYYTMKNHPNDVVITVDDDLYYPKYLLETLINSYYKNTNVIHANSTHLVKIKNGKIDEYMKWKHKYKGLLRPSHKLWQTHGNGVLYPPGMLHKDAFNKSLIFNLSLDSDDVWLNFMSYLQGSKILTNTKFNKQFITVRGSQEGGSLVSANSFKGLKDEQIKNVIKYYNIDLNKCD